MWNGAQIQAAGEGGCWVGKISRWEEFCSRRGGGYQIKEIRYTTTNDTDGGGR